MLFPSNVQGFVKEIDTPVIYSFTAGVQRDLGWNTVFDAAYVGSRSRDLLNQQNINKVPYGARFLPQNLDPTLTNTPLPDNFFRPYPGYGNITLYGNFGIANYDALQMQVTRRFSGGFQFGFSYTLSQAKDYASADTTELPTLSGLRRVELRTGDVRSDARRGHQLHVGSAGREQAVEEQGRRGRCSTAGSFRASRRSRAARRRSASR